MMEVVQCNQHATTYLADYPRDGALLGVQYLCLLLAD